MSKILILANHHNTLRIFRKELIKGLVKKGHKIIVSIPTAEKQYLDLIQSYGCKVVETKLDRRGINPIKDIFLVCQYVKLIRNEKPNIVLSYTIKPVIYSSFASQLNKVKHFCFITGTSSAFYIDGIMKVLIKNLYKISLKKAKKVFFENIGDEKFFLKNKMIKRSQSEVLPGAGVNLQDFPFTEYPPELLTIKFLFIGRIMREKGVNELFYAIKKIKKSFKNVTFFFIGWYEEKYEHIVKKLEKQGLISYYGFQDDVRKFIESSHCVILPSYHEGMSNTLLESASMGRPLIASNIHGCSEMIIEGKNGFLVKVKDKEDLTRKIEKFINLPRTIKIQMGRESRLLVEQTFDKEKVVNKTIKGIGL